MRGMAASAAAPAARCRNRRRGSFISFSQFARERQLTQAHLSRPNAGKSREWKYDDTLLISPFRERLSPYFQAQKRRPSAAIAYSEVARRGRRKRALLIRHRTMMWEPTARYRS